MLKPFDSSRHHSLTSLFLSCLLSEVQGDSQAPAVVEDEAELPPPEPGLPGPGHSLLLHLSGADKVLPLLF